MEDRPSPEITPAPVEVVDDTTDDGSASRVHPKEPSLLSWFGELVLLVGLAFVLAMGVRTFVIQPFYIPTSSMVPTLQIGDRVLVNKFIYRFTAPEPGDIVVFEEPNGGDAELIKRIIAVSGQTIDITDGRVTVDGDSIEEVYLDDVTEDGTTLVVPLTVPEGEVFVMGDNRANSSDSRVFGSLPVATVLGKAFAIYWPPSDACGL
jgi:signal peptidase I